MFDVDFSQLIDGHKDFFKNTPFGDSLIANLIQYDSGIDIAQLKTRIINLPAGELRRILEVVSSSPSEVITLEDIYLLLLIITSPFYTKIRRELLDEYPILITVINLTIGNTQENLHYIFRLYLVNEANSPKPETLDGLVNFAQHKTRLLAEK